MLPPSRPKLAIFWSSANPWKISWWSKLWHILNLGPKSYQMTHRTHEELILTMSSEVLKIAISGFLRKMNFSETLYFKANIRQFSSKNHKFLFCSNRLKSLTLPSIQLKIAIWHLKYALNTIVRKFYFLTHWTAFWCWSEEPESLEDKVENWRFQILCPKRACGGNIGRIVRI